MNATTTLSLELPVAVAEKLEQLARSLKRPTDALAQEAVSSYVDLYGWQVEAVREGIADADSGRLVDHDRVAAWLESWGSEAELPPPTCD